MKTPITIILMALSIFFTNAQTTSIQKLQKSFDESTPKSLEKNKVPGIAVAILKEGKVILKKGYGYANVDKKLEVNSKTGFNIGSISKMFTAWGIMKLVEEGKLNLDAPASNYISGWKLPTSEFNANKVTIRNLLQHTAGLSVHGYNGYEAKNELTSTVKSLSGATNPDEAVDEKQQYYDVELGGEIDMDDDYLINGGSLLARRFWDASQSGENRAVLKGAVEIPIAEELVKFNLKADYVGGSFENASLNDTENTTGIDFGQLQLAVNPSLVILRDDLTVNLGANFVYGLDTDKSKSSIYIYPSVTAQYRLSGDLAIAYGGLVGDLQQNSYHDFVDENPYVSPTLTIRPTDKKYDVFGGLKGQLLTNLGYNIKASFKTENDRALYRLNPLNEFRTDTKEYYLRNSFDVSYDDVKTLGIFAELNVDVNRNFALGINVELMDYNTGTDDPAWNLPTTKGSLFMDYQITEKWFTGAHLFFTGERKDLSATAAENTAPEDFTSQIVTLDSFFDANAHLGYHINDKISVFAKANNIANEGYQRWQNYPVQSIQFLAGATFKFDF